MNATPTVAAPYELDPSGRIRFRIPYNFPNTDSYTQRHLQVLIGGQAVRSTGGFSHVRLESMSGVWETDYDMACYPTGAHRLQVIATACDRYGDPLSSAEAEDVIEINSTPEVSVEHDSSTGRLRIPYSFPNTSHWQSRRIDVYRNGALLNSTINSRSDPHPLEQRSGVWEPELDTTCSPPRTDEILVIARACGATAEDEGYTFRARTQIQTNPKPTVSLSQSEDANGNDTLTVTYSFPYTKSASQRSIQLFVDGAAFGSYQPDQVSGTFPVDLGGVCWTEARAVATACGQTGDERFTDDAEIESDRGRPTVQLTLRRAIDRTHGRFEALVSYDLREAIANRFVKVERLSWIDGDGTEHPDGAQLGFRGPDDPLSDSGWIIPFDPPSGARHVIVRVTAQACGREARNAGIDCDCDATQDPVYFADGNMRLTDTDPLPPIAGQALVRTYDSDEQVGGLFGRGFTTLFEQRLMRHAVDGGEVVSIVTAQNDVVAFDLRNGVFRQSWPTSRSALGSLALDASTQTYVYRAPGRPELALFRASDGKLTALRDLSTGREARVTYDQGGIPQTLSDSWTGVSWILTLQARRVVSIAVSDRPDLTWQYAYDAGGNLTSVLAPGSAAWRTYHYSGNRMTASYDALGNLIESHGFDAEGYAVDSTGPGDEIETIVYNLPGNTAVERRTRVTMKTGAVTDYILRPSGGGYRVVQVIGSCTSCGGGSGDRTYVRDVQGRIVREQHADGFISLITYAGDLRASEERHLTPAGCDHGPASDRCRMTTDELADAILEPTAATIRTEYTYGDVHWPERATAISSPSISAPGGTRRKTLSYHAIAGTVLAATVSGFAAEGAPGERGTMSTLYEQRESGEDGDEGGGNGLAPAFDPGGTFQAAWLSLPQPALLIKSVDGPRGNAGDVTSFVYYPVHENVTPLLRGRLAAVRNAAGHVTRYESYDVFGNATRVVDANGAANEMTFDVLGRAVAATVKGMPGCNPSKDSLCTVDLTTTRIYSPVAGPLQSERVPGGGTIAYTYDERGRVRTVSRGPSAADSRERIETTYDPQTGRKSLERTLAFEGGTWTEKTRQSYAYNALGELTAIVHADGTRIEYTYDAAGRVAGVRDENHGDANTTYSYDAAGRLAIVRQKLAGAPGGWISTQYAYDVHGNLAAVTDPNGNVTSYTYDDFGQMLRQQSPVTGVTRYDYDDAGNLTRVVDANGITTERSYDALNRVVTATSAIPTGDSGGDDGRGGPPPPPTTTTRSETVSWVYDDPGPDRFSIGRLSSMTDPAGTTVYDYERRGLLTQEQRTFGGCFVTRESGANCDEFFASRTFVTGYRHDRDGNRSSIQYPSNKVNVNYTFDFAGRLVSASGAVVSAEYLPFGPLKRLTFANGTTQTFAHDARYRITDNTLGSASGTLAHYVYRYDDAGNITAIDDALDPRYDRKFGYDDLNRIVTANTGTALWRDGSYTWDAMGNPLTIKLGEVVPGGDDGLLRSGRPIRSDAEWRLGGRTLAFSYAGTTSRISHIATNASPSIGEGELLRVAPRVRSNELSPGVPVTYDPAGNEVGYLVTRTYSPRNLLSEVVRHADEESDPFEHQLLYSYDGRGIRVVRGEKPSDGISAVARRYYLYTPELKLLSMTKDDVPNMWSVSAAEKDMEYEIIWFGNRPVAQVPLQGGRSYTFTDHLGTPILQTNDEGTVVWRAEYEPFGNVYEMRSDENGTEIGRRSDQPLRLPGQEVAMSWEGQEENYNIYRWYRSGWGRYSQADPIGLDGDINLFKYAVNNPLSFYDPSGLATIEYNITRTDVPTLADLDSRCRDTRGGVSGGACTPRAFAVAYCRCRCEPNVGHTPEARIVVTAQTIIYSGSWQQLRRTRTPHSSVSDSASAYAHELDWHLYPAGDRVLDIISALEIVQPSMESCQRQCETISVTANREFSRLVRLTQTYEETGRDPRQGVR